MTDPEQPDLEVTATRGRITVRARAQRVGQDLCVTVSGGDREHIGAVAVSQPRASPPAGGAPSTSVITLLGHREDELARRTASRLSRALQVAVCVTCGIHVDAIRATEIAEVEELADQLTDALLARLGGADPGGERRREPDRR